MILWQDSTLLACLCFNTLRPRQNGRLFADDTFKCIFLNENNRISSEISLKFVPKGPINSIPALVEIMAWRRPGDKPLSEPMMVSLLTHIYVTRPQWVKQWQITLHHHTLLLDISMGLAGIVITLVVNCQGNESIWTEEILNFLTVIEILPRICTRKHRDTFHGLCAVCVIKYAHSFVWSYHSTLQMSAIHLSILFSVTSSALEK